MHYSVAVVGFAAVEKFVETAAAVVVVAAVVAVESSFLDRHYIACFVSKQRSAVADGVDTLDAVNAFVVVAVVVVVVEIVL
jgi:hypothetical protein